MFLVDANQRNALFYYTVFQNNYNCFLLLHTNKVLDVLTSFALQLAMHEIILLIILNKSLYHAKVNGLKNKNDAIGFNSNPNTYKA